MKPNIFGIKSVTIEYPKNVTNLSKPIKQPKTVTQQPSKIKIYTESIAADCTLQLDIIRRHILPKNVRNVEILNSKKYDEQLNLTRYSIKITFLK